jgi:hypothetical protein
MWARVENGVVMEVIDFNPQGCFTEEIVAQFVEVLSGIQAQPNWTYSNGIFAAPANAQDHLSPSVLDRLSAVESAIASLMGVAS